MRAFWAEPFCSMRPVGRHGSVKIVAGALAALVLLWALYWPSLSWGWLMDDDLILMRCRHLGQWTWGSLQWALTDVDYGRRWTPVLWLIALIPPANTALGYHVLALALASVLTVAILLLLLRLTGFWWALFLTCALVSTPLRLEVFGWTMGFVYVSVAIFCVAAFLTDRPSVALLWAILALLTYPQAAGVFILVLWRFRRSGWSLIGLVFLLEFVAVQYYIRQQIGFLPWRADWTVWPFATLHYFLMVPFPAVLSPMFPARAYQALFFGLLIVMLWGALHWRSLCLVLVVLAPVLVASITEAFWFCARYSLLFEIACAAVFAWKLREYTLPVKWRIAPLLVILLGAVATTRSDIFARGRLNTLDRTVACAQALGAPTDIFRYFANHLTPSERIEIKTRPNLKRVVYGVP